MEAPEVGGSGDDAVYKEPSMDSDSDSGIDEGFRSLNASLGGYGQGVPPRAEIHGPAGPVLKENSAIEAAYNDAIAILSLEDAPSFVIAQDNYNALALPQAQLQRARQAIVQAAVPSQLDSLASAGETTSIPEVPGLNDGARLTFHAAGATVAASLLFSARAASSASSESEGEGGEGQGGPDVEAHAPACEPADADTAVVYDADNDDDEDEADMSDFHGRLDIEQGHVKSEAEGASGALSPGANVMQDVESCIQRPVVLGIGMMEGLTDGQELGEEEAECEFRSSLALADVGGGGVQSGLGEATGILPATAEAAAQPEVVPQPAIVKEAEVAAPAQEAEVVAPAQEAEVAAPALVSIQPVSAGSGIARIVSARAIAGIVSRRAGVVTGLNAIVSAPTLAEVGTASAAVPGGESSRAGVYSHSYSTPLPMPVRTNRWSTAERMGQDGEAEVLNAMSGYGQVGGTDEDEGPHAAVAVPLNLALTRTLTLPTAPPVLMAEPVAVHPEGVGVGPLPAPLPVSMHDRTPGVWEGASTPLFRYALDRQPHTRTGEVASGPGRGEGVRAGVPRQPSAPPWDGELGRVVSAPIPTHAPTLAPALPQPVGRVQVPAQEVRFHTSMGRGGGRVGVGHDLPPPPNQGHIPAGGVRGGFALAVRQAVSSPLPVSSSAAVSFSSAVSSSLAAASHLNPPASVSGSGGANSAVGTALGPVQPIPRPRLPPQLRGAGPPPPPSTLPLPPAPPPQPDRSQTRWYLHRAQEGEVRTSSDGRNSTSDSAGGVDAGVPFVIRSTPAAPPQVPAQLLMAVLGEEGVVGPTAVVGPSAVELPGRPLDVSPPPPATQPQAQVELDSLPPTDLLRDLKESLAITEALLSPGSSGAGAGPAPPLPDLESLLRMDHGEEGGDRLWVREDGSLMRPSPPRPPREGERGDDALVLVPSTLLSTLLAGGLPGIGSGGKPRTQPRTAPATVTHEAGQEVDRIPDFEDALAALSRARAVGGAPTLPGGRNVGAAREGGRRAGEERLTQAPAPAPTSPPLPADLDLAATLEAMLALGMPLDDVARVVASAVGAAVSPPRQQGKKAGVLARPFTQPVQVALAARAKLTPHHPLLPQSKAAPDAYAWRRAVIVPPLRSGVGGGAGQATRVPVATCMLFEAALDGAGQATRDSAQATRPSQQYSGVDMSPLRVKLTLPELPASLQYTLR